MKININSIDDWDDLDDLPIKEKIVKKKKIDKKIKPEIDIENSYEIDIYDKEEEK